MIRATIARRWAEAWPPPPWRRWRSSSGPIILETVLALAGGPTRGDARDVPVPAGPAFAQTWPTAGFRHDLWGQVLTAHVDDEGLVDYAALGESGEFQEYLHRLANTDPAAVGGSRDRLAFWINAYNALALLGVLESLPPERSAWDAFTVLQVTVPGVEERGKGFFQGLRFQVGGRRLTLDEIEKAVIFQVPEWVAGDQAYYRSAGPEVPDPRVHFALVCAARGCVKLHREAYEGARLDGQLAEAVRQFTRDSARARFDATTRTMHLSRLLEWYRDDLTDPRFSPHGRTVAEFLSRYVDDGALARALSSGSWRAVYVDYDWRLNLRR